jgi:5'-AMP-activated protein kinase, regulatory gamma subunit
MDDELMDIVATSELPNQISTVNTSSLAPSLESHHALKRHARPRLSELDKDSYSLFVQFLRQHTCYELLPISGKIIVLDTSLLVKKAFYALQQNGRLFTQYEFGVTLYR